MSDSLEQWAGLGEPHQRRIAGWYEGAAATMLGRNLYEGVQFGLA